MGLIFCFPFWDRAFARKNRQTATYPRCELPILVGGDQTHIRVITEQHSRFPSQSWLGNRQRESKSALKRGTRVETGDGTRFKALLLSRRRPSGFVAAPLRQSAAL